jgi:hypothetical protein
MPRDILVGGAGVLILGVTIVGRRSDLRRRLDRATSAPDGDERERAEALRQISREIEKGRAARRGFY